MVREYLEAHPGIEVEQLPPYAPDLNPEEFCHGNAKSHLRNATPDSAGEVRHLLDGQFARIRRRPELLLSFFQHAGLSVKQLT